MGKVIADTKNFAERNEKSLWVLAIGGTKRRKRRFSLAVHGLAIWLLCLLYGRKQVSERLGMSRQSIRKWLTVADLAVFDEVKRFCKECRQ